MRSYRTFPLVGPTRHVCLNCPTRWSLITRLRLKSPPAGRFVHFEGSKPQMKAKRAGSGQSRKNSQCLTDTSKVQYEKAIERIAGYHSFPPVGPIWAQTVANPPGEPRAPHRPRCGLRRTSQSPPRVKAVNLHPGCG